MNVRKRKVRKITGMTAAAAMTVMGVCGVASVGIFAEDQDAKTVVGEAFQKTLEADWTSDWEEHLGLSTLEKAMIESVSSVALRAEVEVDEMETNVRFGLNALTDPVNKVLRFDLDFAADELEIGAAIYADRDQIQAQVPTVSDDVLVLPYREGVQAAFPEGSLLEGSEEDVDLICDVLRMAADTLSVDVKGILNRFQEESAAYPNLVEAIEVSEEDSVTLLIGGQECECAVYEVTFDSFTLHDYITEMIQFVRDDEELWTVVEPWIYFGITADETEEISLSPEELWQGTIDEFLTEWVEIKEYMPEELSVQVALYEDAIAAIEWRFEEEETGICMILKDLGGDYPMQSMELYCEITDGDDITSFCMDKTVKSDENGVSVSYDYDMDENDISSMMQTKVDYDAQSGEFTMYSNVDGEEVNMTGSIRTEEKGKSLVMEFSGLDGYVDEMTGTGSITMEIQTGLETLDTLEGPELNVLTATEQDYMNYIIKFMSLAQQIENLGAEEME